MEIIVEHKEEAPVVAEKEKVSVKVTLPRGGVPANELGNLFVTIGEAMPSYEVIVSISTSSQS